MKGSHLGGESAYGTWQAPRPIAKEADSAPCPAANVQLLARRDSSGLLANRYVSVHPTWSIPRLALSLLDNAVTRRRHSSMGCTGSTKTGGAVCAGCIKAVGCGSGTVGEGASSWAHRL